MKSLFTRNTLFSILMSLIPSALFKIESLLSLLLMFNTSKNMFTYLDIVEGIAFIVVFSFIISYYKKLDRKIKYLTAIVFLRHNRDIMYDLKHNHRITHLKNFDKAILSTGRPEETSMSLLTYEKDVLVNYFNDVYSKSIIKDQFEKEITELYNEPFGYFK